MKRLGTLRGAGPAVEAKVAGRRALPALGFVATLPLVFGLLASGCSDSQSSGKSGSAEAVPAEPDVQAVAAAPAETPAPGEPASSGQVPMTGGSIVSSGEGSPEGPGGGSSATERPAQGAPEIKPLLPAPPVPGIVMNPVSFSRVNGTVVCSYPVPREEWPAGSEVEVAWMAGSERVVDWATDQALLDPRPFPKGTLVRCGVRLSNGLSPASEESWTEPVAIANASPTPPTAVTLTPETLTAATPAVCGGTLGSDADGEPLTLRYRWKRNGVLVSGAEAATLGVALVRGDVVQCETSAFDGAVSSAWVASVERTVVNMAPSAPTSVTLSPALADKSATLSCAAAGGSDGDGDALSPVRTWVRNGTAVAGETGATLLSSQFAKDDVLQCTVSLSDGLSASASVASNSVTIQNALPPSPTAVTLTPETLTAATPAVCGGTLGSDADGDALTLRYRWKRNGALVSGAEAATLGVALVRGDVVQCETSAFDGTASSAWVASVERTVVNMAPSAPTTVTLSPALADKSATLSCAAVGGSDGDGDAMSPVRTWVRNGTAVAGETGATLLSSQFAKGDVLQCSVSLSDGLSASASVASNSVTIQNALPPAPSAVTLTPETLTAATPAVCGGTLGSDADGDALTLRYRWKRNGALVSGAEAATLGVALVRGDVVQCETSALDGTASSAWVASVERTVVNMAPSAPTSVTLSPSVATESSTLTCASSGALDGDGDAISSLILWRKNGVLISGATGTTLTGSSFSKWDLVTCEVRASDGVLISAGVASSGLLIDNSAPTAPSAAALEPDPLLADTDPLECVAGSATDVDGDDLSYEFQFRKAGVVVRDWDSSATWSPTALVKGESYTCGARALDSDALPGAGVWSSVAAVQNSQPLPPVSVTISPSTPIVTHTLTCSVSGASDADGDSLTLVRTWIKNGSEIAGETAETLAPEHFVSGDSIVCSAAASDGSLVSEAAFSSDVVIEAGPSLALVSTSPPSPNVARDITVLGTVSAATVVNLFDNASCAGSPRASVSAASFAADGVTLSLTASEIYLTLSGRALDDQGNISACASGLSYFRQPEVVAEFADSSAVLAALTSNPGQGVEVGGRVVFAATHPTTGTELWVTDGTPESTVLLMDIHPFGNSNPANLRAAGSLVFFTADNGTNGIELWATDGTPAGTALVKDLRVGSNSASPGFLSNFNGLLLFAADDGSNGIELWRSDGTSAGTYMIRNINAGSTASNPRNFVTLGSWSYFQATDGNGAELWRTDGTSAGTTLVSNIRAGSASSSPAQLVALSSSILFVADNGVNGAELWSSDGVTTAMLKDINNASTASTISGLTVHQNEGYFFANDGVNGAELWKSNGTAEGTVLVRDIRVGTSNSQPTTLAFASLGSTLVFSAHNGTNGIELYKTDGTTAGTVLVKDIAVGTSSASPSNFLLMGDKILLQAAGELYVSDGTSAGTLLVKDIRVGTSNSSPRSFVKLGSSAVFVADNGVVSSEVWVTDGTSAGTALLRDIFSGRSLTILSRLVTTTNGLLYFVADDGTSGPELWVSDGTTAGTQMVRDITVGAAGTTIANLTAIGDAVYFAATTSASGAEPWRSDGTVAGTVMLAELATTTTSSSPSLFTPVQDKVAFIATSSTAGQEVFVTDGVTVSLLKDVRSGTTGSSPLGLTSSGGRLYFSANDGTNGAELWTSDGTSAGTTMVWDINPGSANSSPSWIVPLDTGGVLFAATTATNGQELWVSDGTGAGTSLVRDIRAGTSGSSITNMVSNGLRVYFSANNGSSGAELWTSDGTLTGTVLVRDVFAGSGSASPAQITIVGARVFFAATGSTNQGQELWVSDGTSAGTALVRDIRTATAFGSAITGGVAAGGRLFFTANDGINGADLWVSDGTSAGTVRVFDQLSQSGAPTSVAVSGGFAYFGGASLGSLVNRLFRF